MQHVERKEFKGEKTNLMILDSLPYIDDIHPDYEAYALSLIEEEMESLKPRTDALDNLPNPLDGRTSRTELIMNEMRALESRSGQPRQDLVSYTQRYKAMSPEDELDSKRWEIALQEAKSELEYERLRLINAELQNEYSASIWKNQAMNLESTSERFENLLTDQNLVVGKVNAKRKDSQEKIGRPKLQIMNTKWEELVGKNCRLMKGIDYLEAGINELKKNGGVS